MNLQKLLYELLRFIGSTELRPVLAFRDGEGRLYVFDDDKVLVYDDLYDYLLLDDVIVFTTGGEELIPKPDKEKVAVFVKPEKLPLPPKPKSSKSDYYDRYHEWAGVYYEY